MEPQDQADNTPDAGFRPAENPFANQPAQSPTPPVAPSITINPLANQMAQAASPTANPLGNNPIQTPAPPVNTAPIADKSRLVGVRADTKRQSDNDIPEQKEPEETLYQWTAPEFAYTQKPAGWYLAVSAFFAILITIAFFFLSSDFQKWVTMGLLGVMAVATVIWGNRKPNTLEYSLTNYGIGIGSKKYLFDDFSVFYEYMDYNQPSIDLVPGKRFGTLVSLPLATADAANIKEALEHMVPQIEHNENPIDKLARRLRF